MSIADKLQTIAENEQRVYDAGKAQGEADRDELIWKMITNDGEREKNWLYSFYSANFSNYTFFKPVIIKGEADCDRMFATYSGTSLPRNIDFSQMLPSSNVNRMFYYWNASYNGWNNNCTLYDMGIPAMNSYSAFLNGATAVGTVEVFRIGENTTSLAGTFNSCTSLRNITIEGTICVNISFQHSPLTAESCKSIIKALKNYSGTDKEFTYTVSFSQTAKDNINAAGEITEADSIPEAVGLSWLEWAGEKGWNVA